MGCISFYFGERKKGLEIEASKFSKLKISLCRPFKIALTFSKFFKIQFHHLYYQKFKIFCQVQFFLNIVKL